MKDIVILQEKLVLLETEIMTLTEKLNALDRRSQDLQDIRRELKGLKVYLGRLNSDFKTQFPEIVGKIKD